MTGLISKTFRKDFFSPSECIRQVKISQFLSEPEPTLIIVIFPLDGVVFPELLVQGIRSSLALSFWQQYYHLSFPFKVLMCV